ncbi:hypothetical protein LTR62_007290 [Meristemomyces frigidus]|uniref:DUF1279 domain-containing protein n=1 Tax=Meristemomyces frigidus TaxID=1508187 RepID=A0AAN7YRE9_9PEZI|nr:hypothetical protein LTR62_007290 [Meristemomyces frigidus]
MLALPRRSQLLTFPAGRDTLLRLFTQGNLRNVRAPCRALSSTADTAILRRQGYVTPRLRASGIQRRSPRNVRFNSTQSQLQTPVQPPKKPEGRFKELTRKYGWAALGVYLSLSVLDFPFCFLAVRWLGTDRIAEAEEWVVGNFWTAIERVAPGSREAYGTWRAGLSEKYREFRGLAKEDLEIPAEGPIEDTAEAVEKARRHEASIWTQLVLAYALHKSLIVFRLPITASITPGIVKYLRKRGWNIGIPKAS